MRYLITGAAGQLGAAFSRRLGTAGVDLVALTRRELDLTNAPAVAAAITSTRPDVILNCAAYNAVDQAEDDAPGALAVNAFAVQDLARAAATVGAMFVHYSTDFVFDGMATTPYDEDAPANPRSVYGQSKLVGEWLALETPGSVVLRVESLFGGPASRSSIDRIIQALRSGQSPRVFVDRIVSPSYVDDVIDATLALLSLEAPGGIYHCVNSGSATWLGLGEAIVSLLGTDVGVQAVALADVPMRAPRPQYCALTNARLSALGVRMPTWQDALARHIGSLG